MYSSAFAMYAPMSGELSCKLDEDASLAPSSCGFGEAAEIVGRVEAAEEYDDCKADEPGEASAGSAASKGGGCVPRPPPLVTVPRCVRVRSAMILKCQLKVTPAAVSMEPRYGTSIISKSPSDTPA